MRKLIYNILLGVTLFTIHHTGSAQGQSVPNSLISLSSLADLRLQKPQTQQMIQLLGLTAVNDGNGGNYYWSSNSTATDDGFLTVQVTGVATGRWLRIGNGNTIKGTVTTSGVALQTAYTVNYQTGALPFIPITVIVNPRSANAAVPSWISSITNSGFTINFSSIPILGTNNIVFDYIVVKQ